MPSLRKGRPLLVLQKVWDLEQLTLGRNLLRLPPRILRLVRCFQQLGCIVGTGRQGPRSTPRSRFCQRRLLSVGANEEWSLGIFLLGLFSGDVNALHERTHVLKQLVGAFDLPSIFTSTDGGQVHAFGGCVETAVPELVEEAKGPLPQSTSLHRHQRMLGARLERDHVQELHFIENLDGPLPLTSCFQRYDSVTVRTFIPLDSLARHVVEHLNRQVGAANLGEPQHAQRVLERTFVHLVPGHVLASLDYSFVGQVSALQLVYQRPLRLRCRLSKNRVLRDLLAMFSVDPPHRPPDAFVANWLRPTISR
mmetsp:Transcript_6735/g.25280  ORF Transcript_6735/g.25280 Transcript_6735/m.25280 type:complete len:308 (-) Transcript_6735:320-1243(-)